MLYTDDLVKLELCKLGRNFIDETLPKPMMTCIRTSTSYKSNRYQTSNKNLPNTPRIVGSKYQNCYLVKGIIEYQRLHQVIKKC